MVSITDDRLLCIQCASKMISELKALLLEAFNEEPKTECADNGTKCAFCFKEYRSEWPTKGFHVVHADDCWLMRAKKAID